MSEHTISPVVVTGLDVSFGLRKVLSGVDLTVAPGSRVGLVGENGAGKTTLLRAVAGRLPVRASVTGAVVAPPEPVLLRQEPAFPDGASVGEVVARTLAPLRRMVADVERLSAGLQGRDEDGRAASAYAVALDRAVAHDAWDAERRAGEAAERLGLGALDPARRVGTLSGGQRTRLALAAVMATRPACVLLDEPTNHLDDEAIGLLTSFLRDLMGVVLLASHDRVLLDEVCTDLYDLDPGELGTDGLGGRRFGGGWTDYEAHRAAARRRWEEAYAVQQEELERLRAATRAGTDTIAHDRGPRDNDRFSYSFHGARVDRTLSRRKRDAQRRLEIAEREQVRKPRPPLQLAAELTGSPGSGKRAGQVVLVRELTVADRLVLPRLDLTAGEQLLVSGANGSGKSTLLGVLGGRIPPTSGVVQVSAARVAELAQDVWFADPALSAAASYVGLVGAERAETTPLRSLGLLPPAEHAKPVGLLSVGQRRRLGLAVAIAGGPDLLLLDEPTNHISLALAGELEEALTTTPGSVVVATHDRWMRRRWTGPELSLG